MSRRHGSARKWEVGIGLVGLWRAVLRYASFSQNVEGRKMHYIHGSERIAIQLDEHVSGRNVVPIASSRIESRLLLTGWRSEAVAHRCRGTMYSTSRRRDYDCSTMHVPLKALHGSQNSGYDLCGLHSSHILVISCSRES